MLYFVSLEAVFGVYLLNFVIKSWKLVSCWSKLFLSFDISSLVSSVSALDRKKLKNKNDNDLFKKPIFVEGKKENLEIECSLKWNAGYSEDVYSYTNNIYQKDGGTHLLGFRSALTRVINKYATEQNLLKKNKVSISGDDIKEGLTCVLSIKIPDPKFSSQTKDKLVSSEVRTIVETIILINVFFAIPKILNILICHFFGADT